MSILTDIRIKSFFYTLIGVIITTVLGYVTSDTFRVILADHGVPAFIFIGLTIIVPEIVKALRNAAVVSAAKNNGYIGLDTPRVGGKTLI